MNLLDDQGQLKLRTPLNIFIGGQILDRGITVANLIGFFYGRRPRDYIYEQPAAEIFSRLLPRLVETQIFRALLESIAFEQGARMTAMDAASKNSGELISTFTLNMNRVRQAVITRKIIESFPAQRRCNEKSLRLSSRQFTLALIHVSRTSAEIRPPREALMEVADMPIVAVRSLFRRYP